MNNFFFFATNEFSQNAFLCWCLNWIQFPGQPLYPMAKELIEYFAGRSLGKRRQTTIRQQMKNIGILVAPKGMNLALIIEDKVMPLEYNEQVAAYRKALHELPEWMMKDMGLTTSAEIRTVFFKTGFHYDCDRDAVADVKVDGPAFLALIQKYAGNSEILDAYIEYLRLSLSWYDDDDRYDEILTDDFWEWSIAEHTIAQHRLMQTIFRQRFPASMRRRGNECFMLRNGTDRRGRPWTRFTILEDTYPASQQGYCLYWQINADKGGPHLALIFYERFSNTYR